MKVGSVIAQRFRIERVVGRGAMGLVVEATDQTNGRRVAVKLILPQYATDHQLRGRFIREANVMSRLQSEHVARVFGAGELEDGTLFLAMEFLIGQSLEDLVKRGGPLPVADAIDLMLEALEAIAEAHALGLVHRDLKPSNIFLAAREGHAPIVKVLDFGIVKDLADHSALTTRGTLPGTPAYMAPEQVMLQADKIDARADVWALGVTLYQVLTGGLPFAGPMRTMLTRIRSEAAPRLRSRRPDVPLELEEIVDRCLAKAPENRYPSAAELAQALGDFRRRGLGRGVRAPAPTVRKSDSVLPRSDAETSAAVLRPEPRRGGGRRRRRSSRWLLLLVCTSIACVLLGMLLAMRSVPPSAPPAASTGSALRDR